MCAPIGNGVMAFACVVGTVCRDAADLLFRRDLIEEVGQHWCITDMAPGDLDSADLQCFLINSEMDLAPDTPLRTAMFAGVPFAFSLDLDPGAIRCPSGYCAAMPERGSAGATGPWSHGRGC